jgi:hypothetical protein
MIIDSLVIEMSPIIFRLGHDDWDFPGFSPLLAERAIRTATITPLKGRHLSPGKRIAEAKSIEATDIRQEALSRNLQLSRTTGTSKL